MDFNDNNHNNNNINNNNNNENPQLVVQLPLQSTTHKTLGVMIYTKDVSGKLALPQFRFFATEKGQTNTKGLQSGFFYLMHYNLLKRMLFRLRLTEHKCRQYLLHLHVSMHGQVDYDDDQLFVRSH